MRVLNFLAIFAFLLASNFVFADHHQGTKAKVIDVEIGKKGFQPNPIKVSKGENLVLMVNRTTDKTCMTALKHPKTGKLTKFPLNKKTKFEVGSFSEAKKVDLLCGMDMKAGVIHIN